MALLFSGLDLKSGEVSTLGLGPNRVTIIKPRRCRSGRWLQEVVWVIPPPRQSQIHPDHPWQVSLSFVSAVRPFFRNLTVTVVRFFLLPRWDMGREGAISPGVWWCNRERRQPCHCSVCFDLERSALAVVRGVGGGKPHGEVSYLSTRHDSCVQGGFFFDCLISSPDN